jgi:hypothetical protein
MGNAAKKQMVGFLRIYINFPTVPVRSKGHKLMQNMNGGICLSLLELLGTYQLECVLLLREMCGQAAGTLHGPKKGD